MGEDKNVLVIHDTKVLYVEELLGVHAGSWFDKDFVRWTPVNQELNLFEFPLFYKVKNVLNWLIINQHIFKSLN